MSASQPITLRYKYQLVNHRRNRRLHDPINIAGQVWNYLIGYQRWAWRNFGLYVSRFDMQKHTAKLRTNVAAFAHWKQLNSQAVKEICDRVDKAYKRFFQGISKRPRFRKPKLQRSMVLPFSEKHWGRGHGNGVKILDWGENGYGKIRVTIGKARHVFKFHTGNRPLSQAAGTLKSVSIKRTGDGKFWLSFVVEQEQPRIFYPSTGKIGGFDFGLRHFLTTEEGKRIESPNYLFRELDELRRRGRRLSGRGRKTVGSGSWKREQLAVSRLHATITYRRSDFHWKLAHHLCQQYDVLVFETQTLEGMRKLWGRKISDLALSEFLRKLEWVTTKTGRRIIYAEPFYPSSRTCSDCGDVNESMPLCERKFQCKACGLVLDRNHNAACNLAKLGRGSVPGQSGDSDLQGDSVSRAPVLTARPNATGETA